ncbi:hypothetical protein DY000_02056537, partial [Brassica cretica]
VVDQKMDCLMNKSKKKKNSEANQRLRSFQENDKVLLQDRIELCNGKSNPIKTFSANQIIQATNKFSQNNQIPGEFIYRGMLENRHVLIKRSILSLHPPDTLARICRDIAVSSMVSGHKNFLKLLGCCLEFEDPVLVSKLSGFCVCVSIPEGQTFVKIDAVRAEGVLDYLEYKYMTSGVVTENTDVFSFGVLLQNLLIGKHGVMNRMRVSDRVCKFVEEGRIVEILDPQMLENMDDDETGELERRQMEAVLMLSLRCTGHREALLDILETSSPSLAILSAPGTLSSASRIPGSLLLLHSERPGPPERQWNGGVNVRCQRN